MNGGALGAYHIAAPWGDSLTASIFGTNAVAWGSEPANLVFASMQEEPEPFGFPTAQETAQARGSCVEECINDGGVPALCRFRCGLEERTRQPLRDLGQMVALLAVGAGLILVGALALTR